LFYIKNNQGCQEIPSLLRQGEILGFCSSPFVSPATLWWHQQHQHHTIVGLVVAAALLLVEKKLVVLL
jgi:hypothetical protein